MKVQIKIGIKDSLVCMFFGTFFWLVIHWSLYSLYISFRLSVLGRYCQLLSPAVMARDSAERFNMVSYVLFVNFPAQYCHDNVCYVYLTHLFQQRSCFVWQSAQCFHQHQVYAENVLANLDFNMIYLKLVAAGIFSSWILWRLVGS